MKRSLLTLLIFFLVGEIAFGQEVVATNIAGDTVVQYGTVKVKTRRERIERFCRGFELGVSGGIAFPRVYDSRVWMAPAPVVTPFIDDFKYKSGGLFAASIGYHIWHVSLSATYTRISELSYKYGPNVANNLVYYLAKPLNLWGLAANFQTKWGVYGGINSAYAHYGYGDRYSPGRPAFFIPGEPAPVVHAVTVGLQLGYTYTFYEGLGVNAEVGIDSIPLKNTNAKVFYFPLALGLRYRFQG